MKKIIKYISVIILVILVTLILCITFLKDIPNFKETKEYIEIKHNKSKIDKVIVRTVGLLGEHCYQIDNKKAYNILENISIKKEKDIRCMDSDKYLDFYFKNNKKITLSFECEFLKYKDKRYKLKEDIIVYNKDEYLPKKITDSMIIVSNKDSVNCNEQ